MVDHNGEKNGSWFRSPVFWITIFTVLLGWLVTNEHRLSNIEDRLTEDDYRLENIHSELVQMRAEQHQLMEWLFPPILKHH